MRVALYGGSFDPPHVAHVLAASYALSVGGFDELWALPVAAHAFEKSLSPFEHRAAMTELAFAPLRRARVCRVEEELPPPSRSLHTVQALYARHPDHAFSLVVGADVLFETSKWHAWEELCRLAPPFVVGRAGYPHPAAPGLSLPELSSTSVRALLARGEEALAAELVPRDVLRYAREHRLYREA